MATLTEQLYSQNHWVGMDGVQTVWNFTFSGGYIFPSHVKAYYLDEAGARVDLTITEDMLTGEFQLTVADPPVPASATRFVIYRNTPKDGLAGFDEAPTTAIRFAERRARSISASSATGTSDRPSWRSRNAIARAFSARRSSRQI